MEYQVLTPKDAAYPRRLRERLGAAAPARLYVSGPMSFLDRFTMAALSADAISGPELQAAHQILFTLREYDLNYIGPWHSVMETEIFRLALSRKNATLALFSAKGLKAETFESFLLDRFFPPLHEFPERDEYFRRAKDGELLMLSMAPPEQKRTLRQNVLARNLLCCALADLVFVPFVEKGSKTLSVVKKVVGVGIPIFTTEHPSNDILDSLGARRLTRKSVSEFLESLGAQRIKEPGRILPSPEELPCPAPTDAKQTELKLSFGKRARTSGR